MINPTGVVQTPTWPELVFTNCVVYENFDGIFHLEGTKYKNVFVPKDASIDVVQ